MPRNANIPQNTYAAGTRTFELNNIPQDTVGGRITFTRVAWPNVNPLLTIHARYSRDNGSTWLPWWSVVWAGGDTVKDGVTLPSSSVGFTWPGQNDGSGGREVLRGTDLQFEVINTQSLTTAIAIQTFTS